MVCLLAQNKESPKSDEDVRGLVSKNLRGELTPPDLAIEGVGGPLSIAQLPIRYERTMSAGASGMGHLSVDFGVRQHF